MAGFGGCSMLSDDAENALKRIWVCTHEEGRPCVSVDELPEPRQSESLKELITAQMVSVSEGEISLTEAGDEYGRNVVRRNRLAERLLVDVLDTENGLVRQSACGFEHYLYKGIEDSVCTLLGHPRYCPHGKPIPMGECCKRARTEVGKIVCAVSELKGGQSGRIAYLHPRKRETMQKLISMGVLPGMPIKLVQKNPSYVLEVDRTRYAVDREIASSIFVRLHL